MPNGINNLAWQGECIFDDAAKYYGDLLGAISTATVSINFDFYIFNKDELGQQFIDALMKATRRGVKIRVVMDGVGSADDADAIAAELSACGIQVRIFHPLPWYFNTYRWSFKRGGFLEKMLYFIYSINQRNHHKLCTIDGKQAWSGSYNIAQYHCAIDKGSPLWKDYGVRVDGGDVMQLDKIFDQLWAQNLFMKTGNKIRLFLSNLSPHGRRLKNRFIIKALLNAQHRIWIVSSYFSPSASVLRALRQARRNGIDVKIVMAQKSDIAIFPALTATYYQDLLNVGIEVYSYDKAILHAKLMLIDQVCIIGSSNLNHRSYYHDLELDIILKKPATISKVTALMQADIAESTQVTSQHLSGFWQTKLLGGLARVVRYWL